MKKLLWVFWQQGYVLQHLLNQLKDTSPWMPGCMLLKECTDDIEINSSIDLEHAFPQSDWNAVEEEFDMIRLPSRRLCSCSPC